MKSKQLMDNQSANPQFRIGYIMQNGAPDLSYLSGPPLHVWSVVKGLQNLGHHVRMIAFQKDRLAWSDDLQNWLPPQYGFSQAKWFRLLESPLRRIQYELRLPFIGIFDSLRFADSCCHLLKGYDLIYERYGYMGYGGVFASRGLGIPLIIELNGNIIKEIDVMGVEMSPVQRRLGRWIVRSTLSLADHIIVVSEALKRQLVTGLDIPEDKISVVLNGANIDLFKRSYNEISTREQYNIGSGPIITFVGNFQPWHGVDLLLSSFATIQSEFPQSQLILVGDGGCREDIVSHIFDLGLDDKVKLLGRLSQTQVAAILSVTDVAVAPYPFDHDEILGTPLKIIEYMAAGKAIVASTASIHEIVADGVTGLRVKPADPQALSQGIYRLLVDDDLRTLLGTNARRQAQLYSWDHAIQKSCDIFRTALLAHNNRKALDVLTVFK